MSRGSLWLLGILLTFSAAAQAQPHRRHGPPDRDEEYGPPPGRHGERPRSTSSSASTNGGGHFVLELEGGFASPTGLETAEDVTLDGAWGVTFGVGGRVPGYSPAYYLVGRLGRSAYDFTGPARAGYPEVSRVLTEMSVGGRVYLPLTNRLRLLLQLTLGGTYEDACLTREGHLKLPMESEAFTVYSDLGLQYRFTDFFSLGAMTGYRFSPDNEESALVARAAGLVEDSSGRATFGLTGTLHF